MIRLRIDILYQFSDGFSINYPIILKEYESLVLKESMRDYFKKKTDTIDGKKKAVKRRFVQNIT
jgi:hypothetical protein